jgi:hypothetical protein
MAASSIITSQVRSERKFIPLDQKREIKQERQIIPFDPTAHPDMFAVPFTIARELDEETNVTGSAFGDVWTFKLPRKLVKNLFLVWELAATGATNYTDYVGLAIPEFIELKHGSQDIIPKVRYDLLMLQLLQDKVRETTKNAVLTKLTAGGAALATQTCTPIPLPWSDWFQGEGKGFPLDLSELGAADLVLSVYTRAAARCVTGGVPGTAALSSCRMFTETVTIPQHDTRQVSKSKESFSFTAPLYQTISSDTTSTTATSYTVNVSELVGSLENIFVFQRLVSDVDSTGNKFFVLKSNTTALKAQVNGNDYYDMDNEIIVDSVALFSQTKATATVGDSQIIPFSLFRNPIHASGAVHVDHLNTLKVVFTQTNGANCYTSFMGQFKANYYVEKGLMRQVH